MVLFHKEFYYGTISVLGCRVQVSYMGSSLNLGPFFGTKLDDALIQSTLKGTLI